MLICPHCGAGNSPGVVFCAKCQTNVHYRKPSPSLEELALQREAEARLQTSTAVVNEISLNSNKRKARTVLGCGALATLAALVYCGESFVVLFSGWTLWTLGPYFALLLASSSSPTYGNAPPFLTICLLTAALTLLSCAVACFGIGPTSTGIIDGPMVIAFIVIPLCQYVLLAIRLMILLFNAKSTA